MPDARHEYATEVVSLYPNSLDADRFDRLLNDRAADGWALDRTFVVDSSTVVFVFRRPPAEA
ncbi:hypothetical protein [Halostella litorea]|uniref:hypothetical protein n=1 Tax=Halostella litorea TaxID=2528831 RepID=UPI001093053A|nr:hypothetical protein [Halostella litorea]